MAEIQYTHRWDGCFKGIVLLGSLSIAILPAILADSLLVQIVGYDSLIKTLLSAVVWIVAASGMIIGITWYFGSLPDYLYFRVSLRVPISYAESRKYAFLLAPDEKGRWLSLTKIKSVPKEHRKKFLLAVARAVLEERRQRTVVREDDEIAE